MTKKHNTDNDDIRMEHGIRNENKYTSLEDPAALLSRRTGSDIDLYELAIERMSTIVESDNFDIFLCLALHDTITKLRNNKMILDPVHNALLENTIKIIDSKSRNVIKDFIAQIEMTQQALIASLNDIKMKEMKGKQSKGKHH